MRNLLVAAALATVAVAPVSAQSIVTVNFTGVYNLPYFGSETGAFSGQIVYNTTLTHKSFGDYDQAITSFTLTSPILTDITGSSTASDTAYPGSAATIEVIPNDSGVDHFQFVIGLATAHAPQFTIDINMPLGTLTSGIPSVVPDYTQAVSSNLVYSDTFGDLSFGHLTSLTQSAVAAPRNAVPEPASWALMLAGFGLTGAAMRRRSAKVRFA